MLASVLSTLNSEALVEHGADAEAGRGGSSSGDEEAARHR